LSLWSVACLLAYLEALGTQFTCFTGTKVQMLTRRKALLDDISDWLRTHLDDALLPWRTAAGAAAAAGAGVLCVCVWVGGCMPAAGAGVCVYIYACSRR